MSDIDRRMRRRWRTILLALLAAALIAAAAAYEILAADHDIDDAAVVAGTALPLDDGQHHD
jgi:hypothetical protein